MESKLEKSGWLQENMNGKIIKKEMKENDERKIIKSIELKFVE